MHVLIIGQRTHEKQRILGDADMEEVFARTLTPHSRPADFVAYQCRSTAQLMQILPGIVTVQGKIHTLDIFFHGHPGGLFLGGTQPEHRLFESDATSNPLHGAKTAEVVAKLLCATAQVRILGCRTGSGAKGRMLLVKLAHHLGERRVALGTIGDIFADHFDDAGVFCMPSLLFSSLGAIDRSAPTIEERCRDEPCYPAPA
jgi:Domain of unknown function (DUF4347)